MSYIFKSIFTTACWSPSWRCWILDDSEFYEQALQKFIEKYQDVDERFKLEDEFNIAIKLTQETSVLDHIDNFPNAIKRSYLSWSKNEDEAVQLLLNVLVARFYSDDIQHYLPKTEDEKDEININEQITL